MSNIIRLPPQPRAGCGAHSQSIESSSVSEAFIRPDVEPIESANAGREDWMAGHLPPLELTVAIAAITALAVVILLSVSLWGRL